MTYTAFPSQPGLAWGIDSYVSNGCDDRGRSEWFCLPMLLEMAIDAVLDSTEYNCHAKPTEYS